MRSLGAKAWAVADDEVEAEVQRYAERTGRSAAAVRARLERRAASDACTPGCAAKKPVNFLMSKATVIKDR